MPNWVTNELTLNGPPDVLREIANTDFDFVAIYPTPADTDDPNMWNKAHWGTKWNARDVVITRNVGAESMRILCRTAWNSPDGLLMYLTQKYTGLTIINHFSVNMEGSVAWGEYKDGGGKIHEYDPSAYKPSVLREFASRNNGWFNAENVLSIMSALGQIDLEELERTGKDGPVEAMKSYGGSLSEFIARK